MEEFFRTSICLLTIDSDGRNVISLNIFDNFLFTLIATILACHLLYV